MNTLDIQDQTLSFMLCHLYVDCMRINLIVDEYDGEVLKKSDAKDREFLDESENISIT